MALDPRFITTSDLEEYFVDSLTGLPLAAGVVTFYSDENHNTLKPVYQLTLVGGSYTYSALPDPVILSSVGTFQDGTGNNIIPYYYPFTGTPDQQTGVQELYFITVYSSDGRLMFTRSAWPNGANGSSGGATVDTKNFIPNGQFLAHNNAGAAVVNNGGGSGVPGYTSGGNVDITHIAQGGWEFVTSHNPSGTYNNSFSGYDPLPNSNDFPLYAFNFVCSNAGGDAIKDLAIVWPDVNKFGTGSPPGQQPYTFYFQAHSLDGGSYSFDVWRIYSYGSGAGASVPLQVKLFTFTSTNAQQYFNVQIAGFPTNTGTISGTDDYVALAIRPSGTACNTQFTDFALISGANAIVPLFVPVQTNAEMLAEGVAGWMPTPDPGGMDLGLPLILTAKGMTFDRSIVGQIIAKTEITALSNELPMNGTTYIASAYNQFTGIPYQRLMNYLLLNSPAISSASLAGNTIDANTIPMFGTGFNFVTLFYVSTGVFNVQINTIADAGSATGSGAVTIVAGIANNYYTATVTTIPAAGYFWSFTTGSSHLTYNVWYSVNGAGTAPSAPSGANIMVSISSTSTVDQIAKATIAAVNQYQFVLPNLAGLFLRGYDPTGIYDTNHATRLLLNLSFNNSPASGNYLGSFEAAAFLQHTHTTPGAIGEYVLTSGSSSLGGLGAGAGSTPVTGNSALGGSETRPVNFSVNYFIKY
jgi:hypothetical protein